MTAHLLRILATILFSFLARKVRTSSRVRDENATYLSRSQFVGAYLGDELIGFIKYVRVDDAAVLIQILAMEGHRDKKPVNALLKGTVEICEAQGVTSLVYGKFDTGGEDSSLAEFKRRQPVCCTDIPALRGADVGYGKNSHWGWDAS